MVDHLVVATRSLDDGVPWLADRLGVEPAVQRHIAERPRLLRWIAAVDAISPGWCAEHGPALRLARDALTWTVTVPDDGSLPGDGSGTWPTLIAWDDTHPTDALDGAGLTLDRLVLSGPRPRPLRERLSEVDRGEPGVRVVVAPGPSALRAELRTPRGPVLLD